MDMALQLHHEHHRRRPLGGPGDPIGESRSSLTGGSATLTGGTLRGNVEAIISLLSCHT